MQYHTCSHVIWYRYISLHAVTTYVQITAMLLQSDITRLQIHLLLIHLYMNLYKCFQYSYVLFLIIDHFDNIQYIIIRGGHRLIFLI